MKINLSKEVLREQVKINLKKAGFDSSKLSAKVCFVLDESWSMQGLYQNDTVQAILDKLLAVSFHFDDDGGIDMFGFADVARKLPAADQNSYGGYTFNPSFGGTNYGPPSTMVSDFYYSGGVKKAGFFGKMFGKKDEVTVAEGRSCEGDTHPVYVFFLTDGEAAPSPALEALIRDHKDLYVQFIGLGYEFSTLEQVVSKFPKQSSLIKIKDINNEGDNLLSQLITTDVREIIEKA